MRVGGLPRGFEVGRRPSFDFAQDEGFSGGPGVLCSAVRCGAVLGRGHGRRSVGEGGAVAGDADVVVGEVVVHLGEVGFGHVAGGALAGGDGAGFAGEVAVGDGLRGLHRVIRVELSGMAGEAGGVVGGGLSLKRSVGVVAAGAGEAGVAGGAPALALFEAVGGEANGLEADGSHDADVPGGAVAGAAEVYRLRGGELAGVDDVAVPGGGGVGVGVVGADGGDVVGTGAVAGLAGDSGNDGFEVEGEVRGHGGDVAGEAGAGFEVLYGAADGHVDGDGGAVEAAGGGGEVVDGGEVVEAAFAEGAAGLPEVALADVAGAEGPLEDGGAGLLLEASVTESRDCWAWCSRV